MSHAQPASSLSRPREMLGRPIQAIERKTHHLHEVERAGENAETPLIAIVGLVLSFASVFLVMAALSFGAYYLAL
jgi:hypothetical protein